MKTIFNFSVKSKKLSNNFMGNFMFKKSFLTIIFSSVFCFGASIVAAQINAQTFSGSVKDENGSVIVGATVEIKRQDGQFERTTTTNERGEFMFEKLRTGNFQITVWANGFAQQL